MESTVLQECGCGRVYRKRVSIRILSGNEVYCTNTLLLPKKSCCVVNFIARFVLDSKLFSCKSAWDLWPWRWTDVRPPEVDSVWCGHPGGNPGANLKSISHRCYLFEEAFVRELTKETIVLPLGYLQGGVRGRWRRRWWCCWVVQT